MQIVCNQAVPQQSLLHSQRISSYWPCFCFPINRLGQPKSTAWAFLQRLRAESARAQALSVLTAALLITGSASADDTGLDPQPPPQFNEYQEKATYLLNCTRYVEWPSKSFKDTNSPIIISILGQDRFGEDLRNVLAEKTVQGRKLIVRKVTSLEECLDSQILFISESEKKRTPRVLQLLKTSPVLTVGETDKFLRAGGIINFHVKDDSLSLEINHTAAERVGLKISSKLLLIADPSKATRAAPK